MIGVLWKFIYVGPDGHARESHVVTPHEDVIMAASVADRAALEDSADLGGTHDTYVRYLEKIGTGFLSDSEALIDVQARDYSADDLVRCDGCGYGFSIAEGRLCLGRVAKETPAGMPTEPDDPEAGVETE